MQESLHDCGVQTLRLHATGLQTVLKLVENTYNNAPLGFGYGRDVDNGPILKIISPNMMRVGRNNERALEGSFRLPAGGSEMVEKVHKLYTSWYKLWKDAVVPRLVRQPKWFRSDKHLQPGDIVYFEKETGKVTSPWIMGRVDQVVRGKDSLIREVTVAYRNSTESFDRLTNRAGRSLVKLFSVDEDCVQEDLKELQKRIDKLSSTVLPGQGIVQHIEAVHEDEEQGHGGAHTAVYQVVAVGDEVESVLEVVEGAVLVGLSLGKDRSCCSQCCCVQHCLVGNHHTQLWKGASQFTNPFPVSYLADIGSFDMDNLSSPAHSQGVDKSTLSTPDQDTTISSNMGDWVTSLLFNVSMDMSDV